MQFSISDAAALAFARGFYAALAHGRGIDEAVAKRSYRHPRLGRGTLEWVTPVLYLRGDARLFDLVPVSWDPKPKEPLPPAHPPLELGCRHLRPRGPPRPMSTSARPATQIVQVALVGDRGRDRGDRHRSSRRVAASL
jgi:hypothetical protein